MGLNADRSVAVAGVHPRRAVLLGSAVTMAGHVCLALPGHVAVWPGLALIVVGTGLLKTSITSMVGFLYARGDHDRRAAGADGRLLPGAAHRPAHRARTPQPPALHRRATSCGRGPADHRGPARDQGRPVAALDDRRAAARRDPGGPLKDGAAPFGTAPGGLA